MVLFIFNLFLIFSEAGGEGGFAAFWEKYLNFPGFEIWKFVNLAIFVTVLVLLLRKPIGQKFKEKREEIRAELIREEQDKEAALVELKEAEAKLAGLGAERDAIMKQAMEEVSVEKTRLLDQAAAEVEKLMAQTQGEIARLGQVTRNELKRFSAEESIRLAEEKLRADIDDNKDRSLIDSGIRAIGGLN
jgi:F0F1-type ATP synthase membrane subunit b/b'